MQQNREMQVFVPIPGAHDASHMHAQHADAPGGGDQPPPTTSKTVTTNVLVDNGSTVVIGGIYTYRETVEDTGIPFLKNLPLIGWLFRTSYKPNHDKGEMVIFLTPRIINQEQAGLTDAKQ